MAGAERRQAKEAASANEQDDPETRAVHKHVGLLCMKPRQILRASLSFASSEEAASSPALDAKRFHASAVESRLHGGGLYSPPAPDFCSATESRETNRTLHNATGPVRNDLHAQPLSMSGCVCVARCTGCFSIFLRIILGTTATTCVTSVVLGHVFL